MRLAIIAPSIGYDQIVQTPTTRLLVERMSDVPGIEVQVYPVRYPLGEPFQVSASLTVHPPQTRSARFRARFYATLRAISLAHARAPFDLIHALWVNEPGIIAIAAGKLLRIPVVASIGGAEVAQLPEIAYGELLHRRSRLITANVIRRASIVTGGSNDVLDRARRIPGVRANNLRLAPLPIDVNQFHPREPRTTDAHSIRLLHAASLIPVKDQTMLLRAIRLIVDELPNARLDIVGEDPFGLRRSLEQARDELNLINTVRFIDAVPHAEMPRLYREADLFLLSSRHESQGMVVLEAAASGVPTVGTAVGVVTDLAPEAAISVPVGDAVAFADAVVRLLRDPERRERMGHAARERAVSQYDAEPVISRFLSIYDATIRGVVE
jgi:glycosyltransferase involved in cell wall biosynthesis